MATDADTIPSVAKAKRSLVEYPDMQWLEDGVCPQVVFEVLSPKNTAAEMHRCRSTTKCSDSSIRMGTS